MLKKYIAKKVAKKAAKKGASWLAKREAQIAFTALATIATQRIFSKVGKKYPALRFLKNKEGNAI